MNFYEGMAVPYSDCVLDNVAEVLIREVAPRRCLDVGAGAGKYGRLVRRLCPTVHITGIEIEPQYIEEYGLSEVYDDVICRNATDIITNQIDVTYDLVIIGDCLEHMRKSEGVDLLNFLAYRCKYMLAIYPLRWVQGSWQGHASEAHISVWGLSDFTWLDHVAIQRGSLVAVAMDCFLLDIGLDRGTTEILQGMLPNVPNGKL